MQKFTKTQKESIALLSIGTFLEYFDLMLYVHMAVLLNELFFSQANKSSFFVFSSIAFCATFVARPLGALLFGWVGDTYGRKASLLSTTFLMTICCLAIVILPTYPEIGITASIGMLLCRIGQGMSSIGEIIGAEIYLTETIKSNLKYPAVALMGVSTSLGSFFALFTGNLCLSYGLNWRIVFLLGTVIALIGIIGRKRLSETIEFVDFQRGSKIIFEEKGILDKEKRKMIINDPIFNQSPSKLTALNYFLIASAWPICFYISFVYCSTILRDFFGYTPAQIIHHNIFVSLAELLNLVVLACLSYKIYPLITLKIKLIIFFIFIICFPYLLDNIRNPFELMLLQSGLIFLAPTGISATPIFLKYFAIPKRFTWVAVVVASSRAIIYVITSFGLVYSTDSSNQYLLFPLVLVAIGFYFGLLHFIKLEKKTGNYCITLKTIEDKLIN